MGEENRVRGLRLSVEPTWLSVAASRTRTRSFGFQAESARHLPRMGLCQERANFASPAHHVTFVAGSVVAAPRLLPCRTTVSRTGADAVGPPHQE